MDDRRLLGQWRELCALRGKGWGRKHLVVDYVFRNSYMKLFKFQGKVFAEMKKRGFRPDQKWIEIHAQDASVFRGRSMGFVPMKDLPNTSGDEVSLRFVEKPRARNETAEKTKNPPIYSEHDGRYLLECLNLLERKGADLVNGESVAGWKLRLAAGGVA